MHIIRVLLFNVLLLFYKKSYPLSFTLNKYIHLYFGKLLQLKLYRIVKVI